MTKIPNVLLGTKQRISATLCCRLLEFHGLSRGVYMMIGKGSRPGNLKTPVAQILKKWSSVSDTAKGHKLSLPRVFRRQGNIEPWNAQHALKLGAGVEDRAFRMTPNDRLESAQRRLHTSRDDHDIRTPDRRDWLAQ